MSRLIPSMKKFEYLRGLSYSERLYLFDKWIDQQFEELRNDPSAIRYTIFLDQGNDYYEFRNQAAALPNGFIQIEKIITIEWLAMDLKIAPCT